MNLAVDVSDGRKRKRESEWTEEGKPSLAWTNKREISIPKTNAEF